MNTLKVLKRHASRHPVLWTAGILLPALANLAVNLVFAYGMEAYAAELIRPDAALGRVATMMAGVMAAMLAATLLEDATRYMFQVFVVKTENHIKADLFAKLMTGRYADASGMDRGELLTRYNQDAATATAMVSWDIFGILFPAVLGTGYLISLFTANAVIGACMLALAAAVILLNMVFVRRFATLQKELLRSKEGYARMCESAASGKASIRQMSAGALFAEKIGREAALLFDRENAIVNLSAKRAVTLEALATICSSLMAPLACVFSTLGWVTLPGIILIAQLSRYLILFTNRFGVAFSDLKSHAVSWERLQTVLDLPDEQSGSERLTSCADRLLEIRDVGIAYGDKTILEGVGMCVRPGEVVALVGPSGAGKTSLVKALLRLIDYTGEIRLCGAKTGELSLRELRRSIAYVPEHSELFDDTVYGNIACANPAAGEAQVDSALRDAALDDEPGIEIRQAGENGSRLSGGQRQRVAVARAVLKDAPLLILDEPTAALDAVSEGKVLRTISALRDTGKGILLITHRESTLRIADRVLAIQNKTIVLDI